MPKDNDLLNDRNYLRQLCDEDLLTLASQGSELETVLAERLDLALSQIPEED